MAQAAQPLMLRRGFASIDRFLEACQGPTDLPEPRRASRTPGNASWYGTKDFGQAVLLARAGWLEGAATMQRQYRKLRTSLKWHNRHPTIVHALHGVEVDVGRYRQRDPECMMEVFPMHPTAPLGRRRTVITVNLTTTTRASPAAYLRRGGAVLALLEALEAHGHAVQVRAIEAVRPPGGSPDRYQVQVLLKDHGESLDVSRLAFALCHVAMLRRLVFSLQETEPSEVRRLFGFEGDGRYGIAVTPEMDHAFDVYIPGVRPTVDVDWHDEAATVDWLETQLAEQGIRSEGLEEPQGAAATVP